jgi:ribosomal protein S18 acetylase RimI-like enzyme
MSEELRPASSFPLDELARIFTAAYEGYLVPMQVDEPALRFMVDAFDLDLDASRVALRGGEPVGLANLGVRGDRAWIGGVGVVPAARRGGLGRRLMETMHDEARRRGVTEVRLEVLEANEAAFRLYVELGYEHLRWLDIWSLPEGDAAGDARSAPVQEAQAAIRGLRSAEEPWQRADRTLDHLLQLDPPPQGLVADGGAAVFRVTGPRVAVVQAAGSPGALRQLLGSLRGRGAVSVLNLPEDDPAGEALRGLGGEVTLRQRELTLRL